MTSQVAALLENYSAVLHGIHHMVRLRHGKDIPLEVRPAPAPPCAAEHQERSSDGLACAFRRSALPAALRRRCPRW